MNEAHFHLLVNHLPIIFPLAGAIVLITGLFSKSEAVKRTAFMIFILGAISAIFAMISGGGAEEVVEKLNEVSESFISNHEDSAKIFSILSYILGGVSIFGLWGSIKEKAFSNIVSIGILIFTFVVLFFAKQTGTSGEEISHKEIRSGSITAPSSENTIKENGVND